MFWNKKKFNPKIRVVTVQKLKTMLPLYIADMGRYTFKYDTHYNIPLDPAYIMKYTPTVKYNYDYNDSENMDCDKLVKIYQGWIAGLYLKYLGFEAILRSNIGEQDHNTIAYLDIKNGKDQDGKYGLVFADLQFGRLMSKNRMMDYTVEKLIA